MQSDLDEHCSHKYDKVVPNMLCVDLHLCCCYSSQTEDEIEEYYRQKYGDNSALDRFGEGEEMSDEITQQGLLPGVK